MKIVNRYIVKTVMFSTFLVFLIVTALTYLIDLLNELKDIGTGDYGFLQAAIHALLVMPHHVYQFFPMLVLLGGLSGLGMLAQHQELIVMRVSGLSIKKIIQAVLTAAFFLIIIGLLFGEGVAPSLYYFGNKQKSAEQSGGQAVETASGVWIHEGNNFLHLEHVMPHHHLEGITRYEFDALHRLLSASHARAADYDKGRWLLYDVVQTQFLEDKTEQQHFSQLTWDLSLSPTLLNVGLMEPEEMSLKGLAEYIHHLVQNGLQATEYQFSFWQRIFQPLTILVMLLLAVPFIFSAPRSVTAGWRMLLGVIIGFVFYILDTLLGQLSIVFQLSPMFAALVPILLFALLGYIWVLRVS